MSNLIIVSFKDECKADKVLHELGGFERTHFADLGNMAIVACDQSGNVTIEPVQKVVTSGEFERGFWELLIGMIFLYPVPAYFRKASGAIPRALADIRIDETFVQASRDAIEPGTSAVLILSREPIHEGNLDALSQSQGTILRTHFLKKDEEKLQAALVKA